ncbi:hypothetical protein BGZ54_004622 [Gamsiella multidivaricata]|nr:hypothetical protein BGZ54_004622 [Gamsiella multidivaricata]
MCPIRCDRLEPYKATCVRTAFPAGAPLSTVSVEAIGGVGHRALPSGKRDRHLTETEILDSCLRDVRSMQMNRLRRIEQFFDRLGIDETRLDEVGWLTEQIKAQQESVMENLGAHASTSWIRQLMPLLQATKRVQQIPSTADLYHRLTPTLTSTKALQATLSESGQFLCPAPKPTPFPARVPLSILNKTMFELSVYDCTQYLGPVAGTKATSWSEEMRFPLPWLVPEPHVQDSMLVLPSIDQMLELIEWMIQSPLYVYFPILTKACILNALSTALPPSDAISVDQELAREDSALPHRITGRVSAVFLLNAIMALGAAYRSDAIKQNLPHKLLSGPNARERTFPDFQLLFDRSRALTVYIMDQPRVSTLQGLLLLMKCPTIPGIQNLYREQACAMALSLGLHRDPEPWTLCRSVIQLRRNIFWCCYVIDASYSLNSSTPERFPDDYITIGLPTLPSIENGDDIGEIEAEKETRRIGFLIEQAKLWRIVKKIRRCGQTSNKSSESYCEGANLFRHENSSAPSPATSFSPPFSNQANGTTTQTPYQFGSTKSSQAQLSWVWRADSARRILDVELAQWQMELPQDLRFDVALTRKDDPCPFAVRVNGLGAMLQIIFNEVLILLHHPFLVLAGSQSQLKSEQSMQELGHHLKSHSSTGSTKSPRSRRSSSVSRSSTSSSAPGGMTLTEDGLNSAARSLPPFLNSCTKAAEAITFLIDHLLRTTPEWIVCHNEVESALHFAERVHTLNVTIAGNSDALDVAQKVPSYAAHVNGQHARSQLRKTRALRRTVGELDQFTMSSGYRPEFMTKEMLIRGHARERLARSIRQMFTHKRGPNYYRLPRSPPETDSLVDRNQHEVTEGGTGQDHLEMRLSFYDQRIWIRYYNVRIKDGLESKNGTESWLEILNPYTPPAELDVDTDGEDESDAVPHSIGYSSADDLMMSTYESVDFGRRIDSKVEKVGSRDGNDGSMDPPQSSSTALMELFSNPNPSGLVNFTDIVGGSPYYPNQQQFTSKKEFGKDYGVIEPGFDMPIYYRSPFVPENVSLDDFDRIEPPMSLEGSSQEQPQSPDMFQPQQHLRGFRVGSNGSQQADESYPQPSYQLQRPAFEARTSSTVGMNPAVSSPPFSTPASPSLTTTEGTMGLGLLATPTSLALQIPITLSGGTYMNLLHQQFPNQHIPVQSLQQQQPLNASSLNAIHQNLRQPFYGMPVGGFMAPSLHSLPEIDRSANGQRSATIQSGNFLVTTSTSGQQQQHQQSPVSATSWTLDGQATQGSSSYMGTSEPLSPTVPSSINSSVPPSPMTQSSLRMMLSPTTTEALHTISNRLNSWDGLSGPKTDTQMDYPNTTSVNSSLTQHTGGAQFANGWSSASSTSELMTGTNNSTPRSSVPSDGGVGNGRSGSTAFLTDVGNSTSHNTVNPLARTAEHLMDGIEAGPSTSPTSASLLHGGNHISHHRHQVSAVPEAHFANFTTNLNPEDPARFYRPQQEVGSEIKDGMPTASTCAGAGAGDIDTALAMHNRGMAPAIGGAGRRT